MTCTGTAYNLRRSFFSVIDTGILGKTILSSPATSQT